MLKCFGELWGKSQNKLYDYILENIEKFKYDGEYYSYDNIITFLLNFMYDNNSCSYNKIKFYNITKIDNGDYQGTLIFLISLEDYSPCATNYLITYIDYGSCEGCDALLSAISYIDYDKKYAAKSILMICKDLISHIKKPYYSPRDEKFGLIEMEYK